IHFPLLIKGLYADEAGNYKKLVDREAFIGEGDKNLSAGPVFEGLIYRGEDEVEADLPIIEYSNMDYEPGLYMDWLVSEADSISPLISHVTIPTLPGFKVIRIPVSAYP